MRWSERGTDKESETERVWVSDASVLSEISDIRKGEDEGEDADEDADEDEDADDKLPNFQRTECWSLW